MAVDSFNPDKEDSVTKYIIKLFINNFIIVIFLILALILLLTNPSVLYAIFTLVPWVWINISRFKLSISKKYYFYTIFWIIIIEGFILAFAFSNYSQFLTGLGVSMFYIALISLIGACIWLVHSISKDKTIINLFMTTEIKTSKRLKQEHSNLKCKNCGEENIETAQYCQECGCRLQKFQVETPKKNKRPDNYKKIIYISYLSIGLILIGAFLKIIINSLYGTLNGTWSLIIRITLIMGSIIFIYFLLQIYRIKEDIQKDPSSTYHRMFILIALAGLLLILQNINSLLI